MAQSTILPQEDGTFWVSTTCKICKTEFGFLENKESAAQETADLITIADPVCLECFTGENHDNELQGTIGSNV
jgi:hypothetical protein